MYKAVFFKEWLKVRWAYAGVIILNLAVVVNIYLKLSSAFKYYHANLIYSSVLFNDYLFYDDLKYIPLLSAILLATAQYIPEGVSNRLRLSLHLPVKEKMMLLQMFSFGFMVLMALYIAVVTLILIISGKYFPAQILYSIIYTMAPWLLCGLLAYFIIAAVSIEPTWYRKVTMILAGAGLFYFLLFDCGYSSYNRITHYFIILSLMSSILIFLSGYRFKRGYR